MVNVRLASACEPQHLNGTRRHLFHPEVAAQAVLNRWLNHQAGSRSGLCQFYFGPLQGQHGKAPDVSQHLPQAGCDQHQGGEHAIAHQRNAFADHQAEGRVAGFLDGGGHQAVEEIHRYPGAFLLQIVGRFNAASPQRGTGVEAFNIERVGQDLQVDG